MRPRNTNELVFAIAKRAGELANMSMYDLRSTNGYGCESPWQSQQKDKGKDRGTILEEVLIEEFYEEFQYMFTDRALSVFIEPPHLSDTSAVLPPRHKTA